MGLPFVLNNFPAWCEDDEEKENWFFNGPWCKTQTHLKRGRYPWDYEPAHIQVEVELVYLAGRRYKTWLPVEQLGRTLWVIKQEFILNPLDPWEPDRQRFDWVERNTFKQSEMP